MVENFGARLRASRQARGWSQAEFAKRSGFSSNHVGSLERGEKRPNLNTVNTVAEVFGLDASEFLDSPNGLEKKKGRGGGAVSARALDQKLQMIPRPERKWVTTILLGVITCLLQEELRVSPRKKPGQTRKNHP